MIDVSTPEEPRNPQQSRWETYPTETPKARSVTLLTDGGESESETDDDADGGNEGGTRVLYLDVEGLFLDVLGLEVDLDEVVLDVSAVPGSGKLLGNLLSAIAGLFDDGLSDMLNGLLPEDILSAIRPDDILGEMELADRVPSPSDALFGCVNLLLDILLEMFENGESTDESSSETESQS